MNLVVLNGRLTSKPELKTSVNGKQYCQFTLAVQRNYKKDNKNITDFIECVAYDNLARHITSNFDKGTPMLVKEGSIYTQSHDLAGTKINLMQVTVLSVGYNLSNKNSFKNEDQKPVSEKTSYKQEDKLIKRRRFISDPSTSQYEYDE